VLACGVAYGQWVPVSSSQTTTLETVSAKGRVLSHQEQRQQYYRKSDGSVLVQNLAQDGSNQPVSALLVDRGNSGRTYALDYTHGSAVDKHQPAVAAAPKTRADLAAMEAHTRLQGDTVNGVSCVVAPVSLVNADGSKTVIGHVWLAPDYNYFVMKEDTLHPLRDGSYVHITRQTQNLQAGTEPDSALFAKDKASVKRVRALAAPHAKP
jgi:hypothetical protein